MRAGQIPNGRHTSRRDDAIIANRAAVRANYLNNPVRSRGMVGKSGHEITQAIRGALI